MMLLFACFNEFKILLSLGAEYRQRTALDTPG